MEPILDLIEAKGVTRMRKTILASLLLLALTSATYAEERYFDIKNTDDGLVSSAAKTPAIPQAKVRDNKRYSLRSGDTLDIVVLENEYLSKSYKVRPDGKLAMPLLGTIDIDGMDINELTEYLTVHLRRYIKEPQVVVSVAALGTTRVYVMGEAQTPGAIELEKSRTVMDALVKAGITPKTAKKNVFLFRGGSSEPIKINFMNMYTKGDLSQNYELQEGDILYLKNNGSINFLTEVMPWITAGWFIYDVTDRAKTNRNR